MMIVQDVAVGETGYTRCRRRGRERRQTNLRSLAYSLFMRRRKRARRGEDYRGAFYVDWHEPFLFAIVFGVLLFCVADAFFTLHIIDRGGRELNPFMRLLLETDTSLFFLVKFVLTASCITLIVAHKRFRLFGRFSGYHLLFGVFSGYFLLIYYELVILWNSTPII